MATLTFKKLDSWLKTNRYKYSDVARYVGVSKNGVAMWKRRNTLPKNHIEKLLKVVEGKVKLDKVNKS